tara:strand:- start:616 stop:1554 length:939 start_codon:yes stop_codon:yes gene_type:complete
MQSSTVKTQILSRILGAYKKQGGEHLFSCPSCNHHKKKLSVNVDKDKFQCWICGFSGSSLAVIVKNYGNHRDKKEWLEIGESVDINDFYKIFEQEDTEQDQEIELPQEYVCLAKHDVPLSARLALKYLNTRGITRKDICLNKIGYCTSGEYARRILVPSFNHEGKINYFVARTYGNDFLRYKNPKVSRDIIFNDLHINWSDDIVLVEGVFDAVRAGYNAIPLLGSSLNSKSILFNKIIRNNNAVYLSLDPDARIKENKIAIELMKYGIDVRRICIDGYEDVADMPRDVFADRKKVSRPIDREECMLEYVFQA